MKQRDDWHITERISHELGKGDPFAAAVRATRMPMVITDPARDDNPIVFCNVAFQELTGYDREEIIGKNCRFLQGSDTDPDAVRRVSEAIAGGEDIEIDLLNYRKDGSTFWNALYISPVRNEAGDIQFFFASQMNVTDRIEAELAVRRQKEEVEKAVAERTADLQAALEAKTVLLHEVDHRVKNNLTMIGSLLRLQARSIADPAISGKLEAMLERVDALATVHRRLYQSDDIMKFDIGAFAVNLVSDVVGASGRDDISLVTEVETIDIPSTAAAAIGLILNEVATNAIKHGFADGHSGTLQVQARRDGDRAHVTIADDGAGFRESAVHDGLGRLLIRRLSRQVGADAQWLSGDSGTQVVVSFPVDGAQ